MPRSVSRLLVVIATLALAVGLAAPAGTARAAGSPQYVEDGSDNPVAAAPAVTLPDSAHCTVTLARNFLSNAADGTPQNYSGTLAPPKACAGPWAKVVMTQTISVSGRQYDRSSSLTIGGAQVYFGTTQEPSGPKPITYTFRKDLTSFASLLRTPQPFSGGIGNYVTDVYTGSYRQTVNLTYYRADRRHPAPRTPDRVVGLGADDLNPTTPSVTHSLVDLPRNVTGGYLQLTLKGNGCDEQWFTAVPDAVSARYPDAGLCAKGPYREATVAIDGHRAGATHTFGHIYSGGIVPTLWRPVLAIGTLDLYSESLDITPFAGALSDGSPHALTVAIPGLADGWNVTANLFLFTDQHAARTSGRLVSDTVAPDAGVATKITDVDGGVTATVTAARDDTITGYVDTSAGRVWTSVSHRMRYRNVDTVTDAGLTQSVRQTDSGGQTVRTSVRGHRSVTSHRYSYPLDVDYSAARYTDDQNFELTGAVDMTRSVLDLAPGRVRASRENVDSHGVLARTDGVNTASDGRSTSSFVGTDDRGRPSASAIRTEHGRVLSIHRYPR